MKILRLDTDSGMYLEVVDLGEMAPFEEKSLIYQIIDITCMNPRAEFRIPQTFLVFSKQEEEQIDRLAANVIGGLISDRGLGRQSRGELSFITWAFAQCGLNYAYLPADGNAKQSIGETKEWVLAASR